MERKIGEIFEYNGEWYQCVNTGFSCADCDIKEDCYDTSIGACSYRLRKDGKQVRFKKLEKVGEPFKRNGYSYQEYKLLKHPLVVDGDIVNNGDIIIPVSDGFAARIKQNQEDMEENITKKHEADTELTRLVGRYVNYLIDYETFESAVKELYSCDGDAKHSNSESIGKDLKPFSLEEAKAGKPVCTRDGRKARIICFDTINKGDSPIIALIEDNGYEAVFYYNEDGKANIGNNFDLMMLREKKEGWINVYKERCYQSEEDALNNKYPSCTYITTIKVEWEE